MSDPALYRPSSAPIRSGDKALARIERISQNARTTWFGLLALMAFIGVTLMAHEDAAFFARDVRTQLPLVGVSVRPYAFFIAAPLILAALYIYLHLYLITLWDALGDAPARPGGAPLSERIFPWLLGQSAVWLRNWRRGDRSSRKTAMGFVTVIVSLVLTWIAGLGLLGRLWTESWPVHDVRLSLWIAACLCVAGFIGTRTAALM